MGQSAEEIARSSLRACYGDEGIFAGIHHFKDYWARDGFFASLGALEIGDSGIVKKNLQLFLTSLKKDGQVPLRIGKSSLGLAISSLGIILGRRKPIYDVDLTSTKPSDSNPLLIIAAHAYYLKTRDKYILENLPLLEKALEWGHQRCDQDCLLEEEERCNWADSVKKKGKVFYTNVCHFKSIQCLAELYEQAKKIEKASHYSRIAKDVKVRLNQHFWTGEHYADWIDREKIFNFFSTDGNMLAILWEVADKDKANKIIDCSMTFGLQDTPSGCVHPYYPIEDIGWHTKMIGLKDYHNGLSWLWLGAISTLALLKVGRISEAKELMDKIDTLIEDHEEVYEVYDGGFPVNRTLYRSEHPFAWSAGLVALAHSELKKHRK
ncbi:MAG: hypothetical protein HGA85_02020 [Nanoarchaeota archaeon]|nr:hypothetical protein [Nanoarchaeota archaeon]